MIALSSFCYTEIGIAFFIAGFITTLSGLNNNLGKVFNAFMPQVNHDFTLDKYPVDTKRLILYHGFFLLQGSLLSFLAAWAIINQWNEILVFGLLPFLLQLTFYVAYDTPGYSNNFAFNQNYISAVAFGILLYLNSYGKES